MQSEIFFSRCFETDQIFCFIHLIYQFVVHRVYQQYTNQNIIWYIISLLKMAVGFNFIALEQHITIFYLYYNVEHIMCKNIMWFWNQADLEF